jgi:cytochrome c oxidase subunit 4
MTSVMNPLLAWLALLSLLALTTAGAFVDLGSGNLVLALTVAAMKAGIVVTAFMKIGRAGSLVRLAGVATMLWLAILIGLTLWVSLAE